MSSRLGVIAREGSANSNGFVGIFTADLGEDESRFSVWWDFAAFITQDEIQMMDNERAFSRALGKLMG